MAFVGKMQVDSKGKVFLFHVTVCTTDYRDGLDKVGISAPKIKGIYKFYFYCPRVVK